METILAEVWSWGKVGIVVVAALCFILLVIASRFIAKVWRDIDR